MGRHLEALTRAAQRHRVPKKDPSQIQRAPVHPSHEHAVAMCAGMPSFDWFTCWVHTASPPAIGSHA
eukprot:8136504-Pyramimonas_sp.AAC.1